MTSPQDSVVLVSVVIHLWIFHRPLQEEKVQNNYAICVTWATSNGSLPVDTNFSPSSSHLGCVQLLYPRTARDC